MESHQHSFYISRLHCEYIPKDSSSFLLALHMNDNYLECVNYAILFTIVNVSHATAYSCRHGENKTLLQILWLHGGYLPTNRILYDLCQQLCVRRIDLYLSIYRSIHLYICAVWTCPSKRNGSIWPKGHDAEIGASFEIPNGRTKTKQIGIPSASETLLHSSSTIAAPGRWMNELMRRRRDDGQSVSPRL